MISWKDELEKHNDKFEAINIEGKVYLGNKVKAALRVLSKEFDARLGPQEGKSFYAWSRDWVYFCTECNGIDRIPRDPSKEIPEYVGGRE